MLYRDHIEARESRVLVLRLSSIPEVGSCGSFPVGRRVPVACMQFGVVYTMANVQEGHGGVVGKGRYRRQKEMRSLVNVTRFCKSGKGGEIA